MAAVQPGHLVESVRPHRLINRTVTEMTKVCLELTDPVLHLVLQSLRDLQICRHALVVPGMTGRENVRGCGDVGPIINYRMQRDIPAIQWARV